MHEVPSYHTRMCSKEMHSFHSIQAYGFEIVFKHTCFKQVMGNLESLNI